jgi:hypothetical protein
MRVFHLNLFVTRRITMQQIKAHHEWKGHQIADSISGMVGRNPRLRKKYQRLAPGADRLYESSFIHLDRDQGL